MVSTSFSLIDPFADPVVVFLDVTQVVRKAEACQYQQKGQRWYSVEAQHAVLCEHIGNHGQENAKDDAVGNGIKPPEQIMSIMDYVLSERNKSAREAMVQALDNAAKAGEAFIRGQTFDKIGCEYNINL